MTHTACHRAMTVIMTLVMALATSPLLSAATPAAGVCGTVQNADGEPEPFATLRICAASDSTLTVALGTADDAGRFDIAVDSCPGSYMLRAQAVGQSDAVRQFELTAASPHIDLGIIALGAGDVQLDEVSVTAQRPLVTRSIDRIGYDVQADTDVATAPLADILKKVPMVSVDSDGTIKVKGSTNFKVYKNGRPNKSFSSNAKDIFAAIPASSIKRIEVITDPGAREDAEGTSVILNIVTVDNVIIKGVSGSANLSYSSNNDLPSPNLWLMTQIDKVTVSGYGGANFSHGKHSGVSSNRIIRTYDDTSSRLTSESRSKSAGDMGYWGIEGSWEPDTLNMVTFDFSGFAYGGHNSSSTDTRMTAENGSPMYSYTRFGHTPSTRYTTLDFGANYQHTTSRKGENLTLSYQLSLQHNRSHSMTEYTDAVNVPFEYTGTDTHMTTDFNEHTLQFDWTRPIGESHVIDVGAKYIRRNSNAKSVSLYEGWKDFITDFTHTTDVAAVYADYRLNIGRWGARAGVRYEYSRLNASFDDGSQPSFGHSLNDVVPSAAVSYAASDASTFRLSYSGSINRPDISSLNPTVDYSPTQTSSGNPDLSSSYSHNANLSYSLIATRFMAELTASYTHCNNSVANYMYTVDDHTYSTYGNVGRAKQFSLSAYFSWSITDKTRWMFNGSLSNISLGIRPQHLSRSSTDFSIWTRITQQLPWQLELSGSLWWGSGSLNNVYSYSSYNTWGRDVTFSLQRSFFKNKRMQVSLSVSNPWGPSCQRRYIHTAGSGYREQTTSFAPYQRRFSIRIGYRFGSLNAQVKKTAASINNDDLIRQSGSSSK